MTGLTGLLPSTGPSGPSGLTGLERHSGVLVGRDHTVGRSVPPPTESPLAALERAVLPALRRTPCLVSFSGGLDSSFVLAVAARVARREGLPPPIPCTWRFVDAPRADESAWQEDVITALNLRDWLQWHADDDLDLVGPVAQRLLTRHGPRHPANLHLHLPIVEQAAGGSLLTGVGGDQILTGWRRRPVSPPGVRRRLHAAAPASVRAAVRQRRDDPFPWLHPAASRQVLTGLLGERDAEPHRFGRRVVWHTARRDLRTTCANLDLIAADSDVLTVNPLVDPGFVSALAQRYRRHGPAERAALLTEIGAGELPQVVTAPRPKAHFLEVFLRAPTRALVTGWDGDGLDPGLVDVPALRNVWSRWPIPGATAALVQQVWSSRPRAEVLA